MAPRRSARTWRSSARKWPPPARPAPPPIRRPAPRKPRSWRRTPTESRSDSRVPLVAAVFPEAAIAAAEVAVVVHRLDPHDVLGLLVAELALDAQAQRRAVRHRQRLVVHGVGQDGLRVVGVDQVDALVVLARAVQRLLERVAAVEDDVAGGLFQAGLIEQRAEPGPRPLADRRPALDAVVAGDLGARRERPKLRQAQ